MKKKCCKVKLALLIVLCVFLCVLVCWGIIHRRVLTALIKKEKFPECPHWLPDCLLKRISE